MFFVCLLSCTIIGEKEYSLWQKDTWEAFPDETDASCQFAYIREE